MQDDLKRNMMQLIKRNSANEKQFIEEISENDYKIKNKVLRIGIE